MRELKKKERKEREEQEKFNALPEEEKQKILEDRRIAEERKLNEIEGKK